MIRRSFKYGAEQRAGYSLTMTATVKPVTRGGVRRDGHGWYYSFRYRFSNSWDSRTTDAECWAYFDPSGETPVDLSELEPGQGAIHENEHPWTRQSVEDQATRYWAFQGKLYVTQDLDLDADDVRALLNEAANRRRLKLEKAHALEAMKRDLDDRAKREPIPQDVKITIWQRDGGRCVQCESNQNLEFDHIIPLAMGGSNTMRNLQLLCDTCNQRKGATLG